VHLLQLEVSVGILVEDAIQYLSEYSEFDETQMSRFKSGLYQV
jgi:hypothetical protein